MLSVSPLSPSFLFVATNSATSDSFFTSSFFSSSFSHFFFFLLFSLFAFPLSTHQHHGVAAPPLCCHHHVVVVPLTSLPLPPTLSTASHVSSFSCSSSLSLLCFTTNLIYHIYLIIFGREFFHSFY